MDYSGSGSGSGSDTMGSGSDTMGSGSDTMGSGSGSGSASEAMLADGTYLARLAMGDSTRTISPSALHSALIAYATLSLIISFRFL